MNGTGATSRRKAALYGFQHGDRVRINKCYDWKIQQLIHKQKGLAAEGVALKILTSWTFSRFINPLVVRHSGFTDLLVEIKTNRPVKQNVVEGNEACA